MGLLSLGTPLAWNEAKEYADHVRAHGIEQFLNIYHNHKDKTCKELLWGDEVSKTTGHPPFVSNKDPVRLNT